MSAETRASIARFDTLLSAVRDARPDITSVILAWERQLGLATVMGSPDGRLPQQSRPLRSDAAAPFPMTSDAVRLMFPEANVILSGQVCLDVSVDVPGWALALTNIATRVEAGLRTSVDDLADAAVVSLRAAGLPAGSVILTRKAMLPLTPGENEFEPTRLASGADGAGSQRWWANTTGAFATRSIQDRVALLLGELARQLERARHELAKPDDDYEVPMRIVVTL
ncbi:hypothetical protein OHB93_02235 [Microbacterium sp. No. 7]|uniref:hypothetical protein n=1 Tax=Microbacterium sp. No. 7 TaxID=1714373 RepID=UPI00300A74A2